MTCARPWRARNPADRTRVDARSGGFPFREVQPVTIDEQMVADRQRLWHDFSRLMFWGALHAAVALIVVVMFAVAGPSVGTILLAIVLIGGNLAITAGYFKMKQR